jgi:beta-lactamase class A
MPPDRSTDTDSRAERRRVRQRRRAWTIAVAALSIVALVLGVVLVTNSATAGRPTTSARRTGKTPQTPSTSSPRTGATTPVTVPPTSTTSTSTTSTTSAGTDGAGPFSAAAVAYLKSRRGNDTAAVLDVSTGQTWTYNPGEAQDTASIVKVDIMATLMAQETAKGETIPADQLPVLTSMIEVSDNDSATSLWNSAGGPSAIGAFDRSIGMVDTTPSTCLVCAGFQWPGWGLTTTTATDQLTLLKTLLFPSSSISAADRAEATTLLENITPSEDWGISGGVPSGVTIALKNGWVPVSDGTWQINSIGWVDGAGRNYLVAVLTDENPDEQYGIDTINTLSGYIWNAMAPAGN